MSRLMSVLACHPGRDQRPGCFWSDREGIGRQAGAARGSWLAERAKAEFATLPPVRVRRFRPRTVPGTAGS